MKYLKCGLNITFCHQQLGEYINICIRYRHVILPLVMQSSTFRLGIVITSAENITEPHLKVCLCPILFPTFESLRLLRPLMKTIQSVATNKCSLGRFLYSVFKQSYRN